MANEKLFYSRTLQKHDVEENWNKATGFVPKEGEIIIYDKDDNNSVQRMKVGDGVTSVIDLPFVAAPVEIIDKENDGNVEFVYPGPGIAVSSKVEVTENKVPYTCPEMFGALADGESDDYDAFYACWLDAEARQVPVYLTGNYYLSQPMHAFPNLNIYGGGGASVSVATSFIDYTASAVHRIMIDNLNISSISMQAPLIRLTCFWSRFNNLHLVNGSHGIYLAKHPDSVTQVENKITNCNFFYMAYGIYSDEGNVITDGMIQNCNVCSTHTGVRLGTSAGWSIYSVHTYGQSEAGLDLNGCWCTMVSNVYTEADNKYGINANCSWYTTITNCILRGAKTADLFVHADTWQQDTTYKPLLSNIVAEKTSIAKFSTITGCSFTS